MKKYKAQAWLTDSSLLMPTASSGGSPVVSNVVPFSKTILTSWYYGGIHISLKE